MYVSELDGGGAHGWTLVVQMRLGAHERITWRWRTTGLDHLESIIIIRSTTTRIGRELLHERWEKRVDARTGRAA
jgi:hypothetical protein